MKFEKKFNKKIKKKSITKNQQKKINEKKNKFKKKNNEKSHKNHKKIQRKNNLSISPIQPTSNWICLGRGSGLSIYNISNLFTISLQGGLESGSWLQHAFIIAGNSPVMVGGISKRFFDIV